VRATRQRTLPPNKRFNLLNEDSTLFLLPWFAPANHKHLFQFKEKVLFKGCNAVSFKKELYFQQSQPYRKVYKPNITNYWHGTHK